MRCWVCTACFSNALHNHWGIHNCDTHNAALASLNLAEWKKDKNRTFCRVYLPTFPHPKNLSQIVILDHVQIECLGTPISPPEKPEFQRCEIRNYET